MAESKNIPREGALAILRNRRGLVTSVQPSSTPHEERVHLVSIEYTDSSGPLEDHLVWEREIEARIIEPTILPPVATEPPMPADEFDALVRATRWTAISPFIDPDGEGILERLPIASPFHGAIQVEDFQLVPLLKALQMPRVSIFLCDDVGLGKTVEAGLILSELFRRRRIRRVMIISPASLCNQWKQEMDEKFSLPFDHIDRTTTHQMRKRLGMDANPWRSCSRIITSYYYLKQPDVLEQFLSASKHVSGSPHLPWDLLIVDEVHNLTPSPFGEDSDLSKMLKRIAPYFEHKVFLSATPHNGHTWSFTGLLERLDPVRFSQKSDITDSERTRIEDVVIRRLKREINACTNPPRFCERYTQALSLDLTSQEKSLSEAYRNFRKKVHKITRNTSRNEQLAGNFAIEVLGKRLLSCPVSFADSWLRYMAGIDDSDTADVVEVRAAERTLREETGDDGETESRIAHASKTVGSWLKPYKEELADEIETINTALTHLGFPIDHHTCSDINPAADARFDALCSWIEQNLRTPSKTWRDDDRLVIFTEFKTTLDYLVRRLEDRYPDHGVIRKLYGNIPLTERENTKAAFNDPADKVRILVATDTASEGINLQETARFLLHYDVPWNPTRLEQRNGRLDRHGQARDVVIHHFTTDDVSDLAFLAYVVGKVNTIREDLGSVEEVFDAAIHRCLIAGEECALVQEDLEEKARLVKGRADVPRSSSDQLVKTGREEMQRLKTLKEELDLTPETLRDTLEVAMGLRTGRPLFIAAEGEKRVRLKQIPPDWSLLIDDHLRRHIGQQREALPLLAFDPDVFIKSIGGRPVFRPLKDTALLHLAHPLYHRALAIFARSRFPGAEKDGKATRWTVRYGDVPDGAEALVLLTVEELAINEMREMFHHWIRTTAFPVCGGNLGKPLPHRPASLWRSHKSLATEETSRACELWEDVEDQVKAFLKEQAAALTRDLKHTMDKERVEALDREEKRFRSRQGEVSKLIEDLTIQRIEREIQEIQEQQRQELLFVDGSYFQELAASQKEKEEELKRRRAGYEGLREILNQERERILKNVIPKRFTLRGEAQVYPISIEVRFPEVRP